MIKPEQIRIGNLLMWGDESEEIIKVTGIYLDKEIGDIVKFEGGGAQLDEFIPITLTEEILIKAGFEKVPTFTIMNTLILDLGRNKQLSIGNLGTPNEMSYLQEVDYENQKEITDLVCIHNYDYNGKLYLHALQNKIYSLTGTELKIEL